jgi:acid stress-induced BolA-like protein IbaG/YrbA
MALQILGTGPNPDDIRERIRTAVASALPDAKIEVTPGGPGHYEIAVVSSAFDGKSRVQQHQLVYGCITDLMSGRDAPVHAIDRLDCRTP